MVQNVLIDVNVILDYLLEREDYESARYIMEEIFDGRLDGFLPASVVPVLTYLLEREAKKQPSKKIDWKAALRIVLSHLHLVSVTGHDALEALANNDTEDELMVQALRRVCTDAIVITRDKAFPGSFRKFHPEKFVEYYKSQSDTELTQVNLLDLQREYRSTVEEIDHAVLSTLAEAQYILGPPVKLFEQACVEYIGTQHAIGVASGTDALVLALRALAIQRKGQEYFDKEDLIITTPFTFTATGDAILRAGATPLFVDVDPYTFNLDAGKVRQVFTSDFQHTGLIDQTPSRIIGMLPVHLYGQSCNMDALMRIAEEHNLFVLEDVAQAFGGAWKSRKLGSLGTVGAFSFYPTKNLGGFGDGGLVTTNNDELADLVRMLMRHGGKDKYNVNHVGYNSRLDTLQAALLQVRLRHLDAFNKKRCTVAQFYNDGLQNLDAIQTPQCLNDAYHVYHQYTIRVTDGTRDSLQAHLKQTGVDSTIYYPTPLHRMNVFGDRHFVAGALDNAERLCEGVLSLPIEPLMSTKEVAYVAKSLVEIYNMP